MISSRLPPRRRQPRRACQIKRQKTTESVELNDACCLPPELLSEIFLYLDVTDTAAVAASSSSWNKILRSIDETLWLGLVRAHCPMVEEVTKLLPPKIMEVSNENGLPAPSQSLKSQFKRWLILDRQNGGTIQRPVKPPPKPLSSYFLRVDIVLYKEEDEAVRRKVATVSRIIEEIPFVDDRMVLAMDGLGEEISKHTFSNYNIAITMYEKASGRQAVLYPESGLDDIVDFNNYAFQSHQLLESILMINDVEDDYNPSIFVEPFVSKSGCCLKCTCCDIDEEALFVNSCCCGSCCTCDKKGSCYWDFHIDLSIQIWNEYDINDLLKAQQLEIFESHLEFK